MSESVLDRLLQVLDAAECHDANVTEPPIALLWPDGDRQWESLVPTLRTRRRVITYGSFDPELWQGPAYWLRCVIASEIDLDRAPDGLPIVYLPGVSRDVLRAVESVPSELAPLSALQYRCQWISHPNGRDWSVRGLLSNRRRGLGLSVASDADTASALVASLPALATERWSRLEAKHVDADFLHGLLSPDPVRSVLDWIDDPIATRARLTAGSWDAFVQQCKQDFEFDPSSEGEIEGACRLGLANGMWSQAWRRYRESPTEFLGIPDRLRQAQPTQLFPDNPGSWPGLAQDEEDKLRVALNLVAEETPQGARARLLELEAAHKVRRGHVWADLGRTPLVLALEHLAELARMTSAGPVGETVGSIADWYASTGWRADKAVLAALDEIDRQADTVAVETAIAAVYKPWADACARSLQTAIGPMANVGAYVASPAPVPQAGDVVLFVDGLRLDVAHGLSDRLAGAGFNTDLSTGLAALPTVTQTSKPALAPISQDLLAAGAALDARRAPDGPSAGARVLRGLIADAGCQVLGTTELGDPAGVAWTEAGELDRRGHDRGLWLAHEIDSEVQQISTRIGDLLDVGWKRIIVVTDHGWLLMPEACRRTRICRSLSPR